jgi:hypothetical protein
MDSRQWTSEESGVTAARKKGKCEKKKKKKKKDELFGGYSDVAGARTPTYTWVRASNCMDVARMEQAERWHLAAW